MAENTEALILKTAYNEFLQKGVDGMRMKEVASKAGVNKAMIHYYFETKEKLFKAAFQEAIDMLLPELSEILNRDTPLFDKIEQYIHRLIDILIENPGMAAFIIDEMNKRPDETGEWLVEAMDFDTDLLEQQLDEAASNWEIARVDVQHFLMNISSLCLFPFIGGNFLMNLHGLDQSSYDKLLEERKGIVYDTILNWIT